MAFNNYFTVFWPAAESSSSNLAWICFALASPDRKHPRLVKTLSSRHGELHRCPISQGHARIRLLNRQVVQLLWLGENHRRIWKLVKMMAFTNRPMQVSWWRLEGRSDSFLPFFGKLERFFCVGLFFPYGTNTLQLLTAIKLLVLWFDGANILLS